MSKNSIASKKIFSLSRSSPSDRHLLLGMNYSEKLSGTNSNVRFRQLLPSAAQNVTKMSKPNLFGKSPIGAATAAPELLFKA